MNGGIDGLGSLFHEVAAGIGVRGDGSQGLVDFINDQRGLAKVKDNKIVVRRDWKKDSDKIKGAFAIARDLAEKVIAEKKKAKAAKAQA